MPGTSKFILVDNGVSTPVLHETTASNIGELITTEFREDYNFSATGTPTVNGVAASCDTPITPDIKVGYMNTASSKS